MAIPRIFTAWFWFWSSLTETIPVAGTGIVRGILDLVLVLCFVPLPAAGGAAAGPIRPAMDALFIQLCSELPHKAFTAASA
jgi:hypothetical protein